MPVQTDRVRAVAEGDEFKILVDSDPVDAWWTGTAGPPCESRHGGHWFCLTHGEGFRNQLQKDSHIQRGEHTLTWVCHEHGPEAP